MTPPDPLLAIALALVALGLLDRLGLWMEARGWIYWRRRRAQGSALGSTFLELQKIFESGKAEHIIEAMHDGRKESQDSLAAKLAADHREIDHLYRIASSHRDVELLRVRTEGEGTWGLLQRHGADLGALPEIQDDDGRRPLLLRANVGHMPIGAQHTVVRHGHR